jgi:hypothetical protein
MASTQEKCTEWIMRQVFEGSRGELSSKHPMVVSCGGIYIPHPEAQRNALYHILVTPNHSEPVKVMTGVSPRNALHDLLSKESMN